MHISTISLFPLDYKTYESGECVSLNAILLVVMFYWHICTWIQHAYIYFWEGWRIVLDDMQDDKLGIKCYIIFNVNFLEWNGGSWVYAHIFIGHWAFPTCECSYFLLIFLLGNYSFLIYLLYSGYLLLICYTLYNYLFQEHVLGLNECIF